MACRDITHGVWIEKRRKKAKLQLRLGAYLLLRGRWCSQQAIIAHSSGSCSPCAMYTGTVTSLAFQLSSLNASRITAAVRAHTLPLVISGSCKVIRQGVNAHAENASCSRFCATPFYQNKLITHCAVFCQHFRVLTHVLKAHSCHHPGRRNQIRENPADPGLHPACKQHPN